MYIYLVACEQDEDSGPNKLQRTKEKLKKRTLRSSLVQELREELQDAPVEVKVCWWMQSMAWLGSFSLSSVASAIYSTEQMILLLGFHLGGAFTLF